MNRKEYTIYFTFKCNWSCDYCIMDTHNVKSEPQNILENIRTIDNNSFVSISGGEPGLGDKYIIEEAFNILIDKNCTIHLNTNGVFLNKFPHLIQHINSITYHCSEYLDSSNFKRYPDIKQLSYEITITDSMMDKLEEFFSNNNDLKFLVFSADKIVNHNGTTNNHLSKKNILQIYRKYKQYILPESYEKLFGRCQNFSQHLGYTK